MSVKLWQFTVSVLLFFIVWEWVRPLVELAHVTDLYVAEPILVAVGCFIILDYLRCPSWLGWPLKIIVSLTVIGYFFHHQFLTDLSWWVQYKDITLLDVSHLLQGSIEISAENRTLFLFVGLALLMAVVQSLMLSWQSGSYLVVLTLMYLMMLQLVTDLNTTVGIMRTFGMGMMLISVLHIAKIGRIHGMKLMSFYGATKWIIASLVIVGMTMTIGVSSAHMTMDEKQLAQSTRSTHMTAKFHSWLEERYGSRSQAMHIAPSVSQAELARSGYGGDHIQLGGKVIPDDGVVFIAQTKGQVYWRGESKSRYDGIGWFDGKLQESMNELYLQLPDSLPERIKQLAMDVVGTESDPIKQAREIERYLKTNYTYNLEDPDYPPAGQDFVDHFLFEQRFGYCDHFSTAMVMMLRTLNIPARWVRGFGPGEEVTMPFEALKLTITDPSKHGKPSWLEATTVATGAQLAQYTEDNVQVYVDDQPIQSVIVRHLHAHSWVEVYFPKHGWVAFEPTPGLANSLSSPAEASAFSAPQEASATLGQQVTNWVANWIANWAYVIIIPLLLALIIMLVFSRVKARWAFRRSLKKITTTEKTTDTALHSFEFLWSNIFQRYGPMQPAQTMREYVAVLTTKKPSQHEALKQFVAMYESVRYNSTEQQTISQDMMIGIWKRI